MSEAIPTRIVCPSCNISIFTRVNRDGAVEALLQAAKGITAAIEAHHPKYAHGPFTLTRAEIESLRAAIAQVEGNS